MQSPTLSSCDYEEDFDPARPLAIRTSVNDSPSSPSRDPPRDAGGSWRGEGPNAAWCGRSDSEEPQVPGSHKDDRSPGAASSPLKTFLGIVASTAGLLTGGSPKLEQRPVRTEATPSGRSDKGKGRQVTSGEPWPY